LDKKIYIQYIVELTKDGGTVVKNWLIISCLRPP